jgi:hypothetical protein
VRLFSFKAILSALKNASIIISNLLILPLQ